MDPKTKKMNAVERFFSSSQSISSKTKYSILQWAAAAIHFMLIFIFAALGVYPMVVFNIFSTICYLSCRILIKHEKYIIFYYITFAEICLHSYTAAILVGWTSGFPLYIVGITPVIFYMHFSLHNSPGLKEATLIGISAMLMFLTCKLISHYSEPFYTLTNVQTLLVYVFNTVCTFCMLLFFSLFFLREIKTSREILEEQNARLDKMAGIDALTGLYNRRSMNKFINNACVAKKVFSFIMCDIDDFKRINDTYGHQCGDRVLKAISDIIVANIRENDYVCRWGGEEMLILVNGSPIDEAASVAERIRQQIEEMVVDAPEGEVNCTITVGIADSKEADQPDDIIAVADKRLYKGKASGKNCVVIC